MIIIIINNEKNLVLFNQNKSNHLHVIFQMYFINLVISLDHIMMNRLIMQNRQFQSMLVLSQNDANIMSLSQFVGEHTI
eukprot:UN09327